MVPCLAKNITKNLCLIISIFLEKLNLSDREFAMVAKMGRPEMGTSKSICFFQNMMQTREGFGSQRSWFPLTKSAKKACPSFHPYLEALTISGDSQSIVVIEVDFSFTISSSIDSKKNYFNQF